MRKGAFVMLWPLQTSGFSVRVAILGMHGAELVVWASVENGSGYVSNSYARQRQLRNLNVKA